MKEIDILNLTKLVKQMETQKNYFCYKKCDNHGDMFTTCPLNLVLTLKMQWQ